MDPLTFSYVPIVLALVVDGMTTVITSVLYKRHVKTINDFRSELNKLNHPKPNYGFVIPVYKNPKEADECINHLINVVGVSTADIIVIDDFSDDDGKTRQAIEQYGVEVLQISKSEKDIRKVRAQKKGVAKWIERDKKYVICLDSDSYIKTDLIQLELAIAEMELLNLDVVTGQILPALKGKPNLLERIQYVEYAQAMRANRGALYALKQNHNGKVTNKNDLKNKYSLAEASQLTIPGAFGIFQPQILKEVLDEMKIYGGGEDIEITHRLLAKKAKIGIDLGLLIETKAPTKLLSWFKQRDLWEQFSMSYFVDGSSYIEPIFTRKTADRKQSIHKTGKIFFGLDIFKYAVHPIKIASVPFLFLKPLLFVALILLSFGMSLYCSYAIKTKDERFDWLAEFLLPFYRLGHLVGPTTLSYARQIIKILIFFSRRWKNS